MKRRSPLTPKQLLLALLLFFIFAGMILFLFGYKRDEKQFAGLTSELFTREMTSSTLNMHYTLAHPENFGIHSYRPLLPSYSAENAAEAGNRLEDTLTALKRIRPQKLSLRDRYAYTLLLRSLENTLETKRWPYYEEPLSPASGMQTQLPILLAEYTFRTKRDVMDYLTLLKQTETYFSSLLRFEQEKASAGLLMPEGSLEKVIEQCDTIITKESLAAGSHFLQTTFEERILALTKTGAVTEAESVALTEENERILKKVLLPAYEALGDGLFLLKEHCAPLSGLSAKSRGRAYYEKLLIEQTGSYRDITEIQSLLSAKFKEEYEAVRQIAAGQPDLVEALLADKNAAFPYTEAEHMLLDLQKRMSKDFPPFPGNSDALPTVIVKTVSPSLAPYTAPAFYLTAPLDDTDNNVIYINQKNSPAGLELYTTLAHEGYPGHLYQTVYSNRSFMKHGENKARQLLWYGGYQEGWALYVEFLSFDYAARLLAEHGQPSAALSAQLQKHNRSLQLCLYSILDIMIHYENASFQQAAKLLEGFGITETASVKAVYSYIAEEPCNYLKYYLGYLEILALNEQAKKLWGKDYSLRRFHTFFLDCGPSDFTTLQECLQLSEKTVKPD